MIIWQMILGLLVSLSFLLGAVLYSWTKEEIDKSYHYLAWLTRLKYWQAGIIGAALAFCVKLANFELVSLVFVGYGLILASYVCHGSKNNSVALKRASKLALTFLAVFLIVLLIQFVIIG